MDVSIDASRNEAPVTVFFSHAHEDERFVERLARHLSALEAQGIIRRWSRRDLLGGDEVEMVVQRYLDSADLILLFVTADYLQTKDAEAQCAIEQAKSRGVRVIPILVRPCHWEESRFGKLQALPRNCRAVTSWPEQDEAWSVIAREITTTLRSAPAAATEPVGTAPAQTQGDTGRIPALPGDRDTEDEGPDAPLPFEADVEGESAPPATQRALTRLARWPVLSAAAALLCVSAFIARAALPWPRLPPGSPGFFAAANILQHMGHMLLLAGISLYIAVVGRRLDRSYLYYDDRARAFAFRCIAILQMFAFCLSVNYVLRLSVGMVSCGIDDIPNAAGACPGPGVYRALHVAFMVPGALGGLLLFWLQLEWWNPFAGSTKHVRRLAWAFLLALSVATPPCLYWALAGWPDEGAGGWSAGHVTARALLSSPGYLVYFVGMVLIVSGLYARYRTTGVLGSFLIFMYAGLQPVWPWATVFPENHWWLGWFVLVCKLPLFWSLIRPIRDGQIWQARSATQAPSVAGHERPSARSSRTAARGKVMAAGR